MKDLFKTRDLPTAALLLDSPGIQFQGFEPCDLKSRYFLFSPRQRCERRAMEFIAGTATVNARSYADAVRRAKDLVFSEERQLRAV